MGSTLTNPSQSTPNLIPNTNSWAWKARFAHKLANVLIPWRFSCITTAHRSMLGLSSREEETSICGLWQLDDWRCWTDTLGRIKRIYLSGVLYFTWRILEKNSCTNHLLGSSDATRIPDHLPKLGQKWKKNLRNHQQFVSVSAFTFFNTRRAWINSP